jgi:sulfonate transport system substrate-binding protein
MTVGKDCSTDLIPMFQPSLLAKQPAKPWSAALRGLGILAVSGAGVLLLQGPVLYSSAAQAQAANKTVRIGFQKSGTVLLSLKAKRILEDALKPSGFSVQWSEFPAGLPMVEALNAGAIDVAYVGEAPPIFAQAANGSISRYVAYDPYGPRAEGILVGSKSAITRLADLKGKKIAVQKGSNSHYLLVKALRSANLSPSQVQIIFLKPSDARVAFERGDVDAWSVWDPYLAAAESKAGARLLTDARGLAPNLGYYLASAPFVKTQPATLRKLLEGIRNEAKVVSANPKATAAFLAPSLGVDVAVLTKAEQRRKHDVLPISDAVIAKQQDVADTFSELGLIPRPIRVKEAVWRWN